jgi:hypothetical protein
MNAMTRRASAVNPHSPQRKPPAPGASFSLRSPFRLKTECLYQEEE